MVILDELLDEIELIEELLDELTELNIELDTEELDCDELVRLDELIDETLELDELEETIDDVELLDELTELNAELDTDEEIKLDALDELGFDEILDDLADELELIEELDRDDAMLETLEDIELELIATDEELIAITEERLEALTELLELVIVELLELVRDCCELLSELREFEIEVDRELDEDTDVIDWLEETACDDWFWDVSPPPPPQAVNANSVIANQPELIAFIFHPKLQSWVSDNCFITRPFLKPSMSKTMRNSLQL